MNISLNLNFEILSFLIYGKIISLSYCIFVSLMNALLVVFDLFFSFLDEWHRIV